MSWGAFLQINFSSAWTVVWDVGVRGGIYNEKLTSVSMVHITIKKGEGRKKNQNAIKDMKHRGSEYKWWLPARKIRVDVSLSSKGETGMIMRVCFLGIQKMNPLFLLALKLWCQVLLTFSSYRAKFFWFHFEPWIVSLGL